MIKEANDLPDLDFDEFMDGLKEYKQKEKERVKSLSPLDALNELVNPLCELEIDENMIAKGVLSGKYGILYTKVKNALERLEEYEKNKEC